MINDLETMRLSLTSIVPPGGRSLFSSDPSRPESKASYEDLGGYGERDPETVLELVRAADVRGCGGAGFPTARKIDVARAADAAKRILVINGAESEPTSLKDRYLMRFRPHLVLDGARIVADLLQTKLVFVGVGDEPSKESLRAAAEELTIPFKPRVQLLTGGYVKGESSALVAALNGRKALPQFKPPRPFERGVAGYPTLVLNVETVSQIALLAASAIPAAQLPRLATVTRRFGVPQLVACNRSSSIRDIIGSPDGDFGPAVMASGFFGGLATWAIARTAILSDWEGPDSEVSAGSLSLVAIDADDCPVAAAAEAANYLASENASQCGSCVNGTAAFANALQALATGLSTEQTLTDLRRWSTMLPGRGACSVPDGLARLTGDLLARFDGSVQSHLRERCPVCQDATFKYGHFSYGIATSALDRIEVSA